MENLEEVLTVLEMAPSFEIDRLSPATGLFDIEFGLLCIDNR